MARFLLILSFLFPVLSFAGVLELYDFQVKGEKYVQVVDDVKEETSIAFKERVDVYEAPCGSGFEIIVNTGDQIEYIGYGCEAKERTKTLYRKDFDSVKK